MFRGRAREWSGKDASGLFIGGSVEERLGLAFKARYSSRFFGAFGREIPSAFLESVFPLSTGKGERVRLCRLLVLCIAFSSLSWPGVEREGPFVQNTHIRSLDEKKE
jgi:hypothetical protein